MKFKKPIVLGFILVFMCTLGFCLSVQAAGAGSAPGKAPVAAPPAKAPAAKAPVVVEEETIAGTVVKTDKGIIIEAEDGDYLVKGQDLSKMVGKMVEATGIIKESDKGDIIEVKSVEEIQE